MEKGRKRLSEFSHQECEDAFKTLDLPVKRLLLESVVHTTDALLFRDVLMIIVFFVDLQTWARLRQTCKTFNVALNVYPPLLKIEVLLFQKYSDELYRKKSECSEMFGACVKRFLINANAFMEEAIAEFNRNPPPPERIPRPDGTEGLIYPKPPPTFPLLKILDDLKHFLSGNKSNRRWFTIQSMKIKIFFPFGYICLVNEARHPHGNIFMHDWKDLFVLSYYSKELRMKIYKQMNSEQRLRFKMQTDQISEIKKRFIPCSSSLPASSAVACPWPFHCGKQHSTFWSFEPRGARFLQDTEFREACCLRTSTPLWPAFWEEKAEPPLAPRASSF